MLTKMLTTTNDRIIIKPNCDKSPTNIKSNIIDVSIIDEKGKHFKMDTGATTGTASTITSHNDHLNHETIIGRPLNSESSFICDYSLTSSFCGGEENKINIKTTFENDFSDRGGEQDGEIFYDSTSESEDYENEKTNEKRNQELMQNDNKCEEEACVLAKLHLNDDNEIVDTEETQTATELENVAEKDKMKKQNKSLRVAFGVIFRLIFPLTNGVVQGIKGIRDVRFLNIMRSIASSRMALTDLFAYAANTISLNLSSVQVSHRIEPILNLLKIRISRDGMESLADSSGNLHGEADAFHNLTNPTFCPLSREPRYSLPNFQFSSKKLSLQEVEATKCCSLNILAAPPADQPIRADIVFIHGLNGSQANTWKQGLWENERRPVEFQRPPKPPVRPPKRPRHSRTSAVHPLHHKKRARFSYADVSQRDSHERDAIEDADENNFSLMCNESKDLPACDDFEYSFSTYRSRVQDNGRLLQAEHDSKLRDDTNTPDDSINSNVGKDFNKKPLKLTANDPNYSKCWPGDWLPIDCPGVRVIALNYTTDQHLWRPVWKKKEARSNLIQRSREMIELLIKHRVGYGHPIVWVGHSKGGLFIKQIIVDSWESGRPAAAPFWRSARGAFFYSVPHRGSHLASIKAPFLLRSVELLDVEKNNKYLLDLHRRFVGLYHLGHLKIEVFSFVETALTLMSVLYMRIVGVDSADPGIGDVCGIRLDHREICKPRSRDCILYRQLVNMINKVS